jgi:hypothetical protein
VESRRVQFWDPCSFYYIYMIYLKYQTEIITWFYMLMITSIVIRVTNIHNFKIILNRTFGEINTWFYNSSLYFVHHFGRHFVTVRLYVSVTLCIPISRNVFLGNTLTFVIIIDDYRDSSSGRLGLTPTKHLCNFKTL